MDLVVKESRTGLGAFLQIEATAGDLIVDWSLHPLFQKKPWIPRDWRFKTIAPGVFTGPIGPEKYPDAYINHSCDPNAEIIFDRPKIHLIARRLIASGEEVTFDYATLYKASFNMKCECASAQCRGVIRGSPSSPGILREPPPLA